MQIITATHQPPSVPAPLSAVLPLGLCDAIRRCGAPAIEELRLHTGRCASVTHGRNNYLTGYVLSDREMQDILQRMCGGSLYAYSESICKGYLCMPEGIRVGISGTAAIEAGRVIGVSAVSGLVIRVPHKISVDASPILSRLQAANGLCGLLIYAPPGVGKTTLLRAVAKEASSPAYGLRTVVVDTREELHYTLDGGDLLLDILVGYPKELGIEIAVRSLGAQLIVCDEIGSTEDAKAILAAANCGVPLVASAHAKDIRELLSRPAMLQLHRARAFGTYIGLRREGGRFQYKCTPWNEADGS